MNMIPVSSSNLVAVGYDEISKTLLIRFRNGTYAYSGVPQHVYESLMHAGSKGRYHDTFIKDRYPCRKVSY